SLSSTVMELLAPGKPGADAETSTSRGPSTMALSGTVRLNATLDWPALTVMVVGTTRLGESLEMSVTMTFEEAIPPSVALPALVRTPLPSTTEAGNVRLSVARDSSVAKANAHPATKTKAPSLLKPVPIPNP